MTSTKVLNVLAMIFVEIGEERGSLIGRAVRNIKSKFNSLRLYVIKLAFVS